MFHRLAQVLNPSKNLCVSADDLQAVVQLARNTVSSAYVASSVFLPTVIGKSAVYNVYKAGPKTLPCGTPTLMRRMFDRSPLTSTIKERPSAQRGARLKPDWKRAGKNPDPSDSVVGRQSTCAANLVAGARAKGELPTTSAAAKRFTYADRRKAASILKRQNASTVANPPAEWQNKVVWARKVLPNFCEAPPNKEQSQAKRQRSQEAHGPFAKRAKVQKGRSFADIAKERILIGILDKGNKDGKISRNQWKWVEGALAVQCLKLLSKAPGMLGGTRIPASLKEPDQVLNLLQLCNPSLAIHDWRVVKIEATEGPTNQAVLILNKESLAPIEAAKGELNFGFVSITVKVYKSDAPSGGDPVVCNKTAEQGPPAEIGDTSTLTRGLEALCHELDEDNFTLSDEDDSNNTVMRVESPDVLETTADKPSPHNADNTTVSLELQSAPVRLLSAYMANDSAGPPPDEITRSLVEECEKHRIGLVIGCDANAHHHQWGSTDTNSSELTERISSVEKELFPLQCGNKELTSKIEELNVKTTSLRTEAINWRQSANALVEKSNRNPGECKRL
ncbi:GH24958 [Drosophila grimshawi]|uniref:GH24958 n=1 Tax=Drosophila grimshawi TaxID=7222 RepID=B4K0D9_DROGR|nr:GH24958 [Drosophila grimshawi]